MYYAEKWIDGKLYYKNLPKAEWRLLPTDKLYQRIKTQKQRIGSLTRKLDEVKGEKELIGNRL